MARPRKKVQAQVENADFTVHGPASHNPRGNPQNLVPWPKQKKKALSPAHPSYRGDVRHAAQHFAVQALREQMRLGRDSKVPYAIKQKAFASVLDFARDLMNGKISGLGALPPGEAPPLPNGGSLAAAVEKAMEQARSANIGGMEIIPAGQPTETERKAFVEGVKMGEAVTRAEYEAEPVEPLESDFG
jgi:hypothetical protein